MKLSADKTIIQAECPRSKAKVQFTLTIYWGKIIV